MGRDGEGMGEGTGSARSRRRAPRRKPSRVGVQAQSLHTALSGGRRGGSPRREPFRGRRRRRDSDSDPAPPRAPQPRARRAHPCSRPSTGPPSPGARPPAPPSRASGKRGVPGEPGRANRCASARVAPGLRAAAGAPESPGSGGLGKGLGGLGVTERVRGGFQTEPGFEGSAAAGNFAFPRSAPWNRSAEPGARPDPGLSVSRGVGPILGDSGRTRHPRGTRQQWGLGRVRRLKPTPEADGPLGSRSQFWGELREPIQRRAELALFWLCVLGSLLARFRGAVSNLGWTHARYFCSSLSCLTLETP